MHIGNYIEMVHKSGKDISEAFRMVAKEHGAEPDVKGNCLLLAKWTDDLVEKMKPFIAKYGEEKSKEPDRLMSTLFDKPRKGSMGLLRDLQDLWLMADEAQVCSIILRQAASGLRDKELIEVCTEIEGTAKRQASWLLTRMKSAATQTLIVGGTHIVALRHAVVIPKSYNEEMSTAADVLQTTRTAG